MPRRKTAKRQVKRKPNAQNKIAYTLSKLEKDFHDAPAKLLKQFNKEVDLHKQKEKKTKTVLLKAKSQLKHLEARLKQTAKSKNTTMGRKRYQASKKALAKHNQLVLELNSKLKEITKLLTIAMNKQEKLQALRKQLSQFEKDWIKQSKKLKAKSSAKKRKTRTKNKANIQQEQAPQPDFFNHEATEPTKHEEPFEMTS